MHKCIEANISVKVAISTTCSCESTIDKWMLKHRSGKNIDEMIVKVKMSITRYINASGALNQWLRF